MTTTTRRGRSPPGIMGEQLANKYRSWHDAIIERARQPRQIGYTVSSPDPGASQIGYCERHHVLPRCLGGGDAASNLGPSALRKRFFSAPDTLTGDASVPNIPRAEYFFNPNDYQVKQTRMESKK